MSATTAEQQPALSVEAISKSYGATVALADVDLTVMPGEIHALLGANGAGKSTLLGVIAGNIRQDSGSITVGGAEDGRLSERVAIVHQELSLLGDLSVAENVCPREALFGHRGISRQHAARAAAGDALAMLQAGLEGELDRPVKELSLDKRELVEIARGVCSGSRIILLDEPTSPLNEAETEHLFDVLRRLAAEGVAIVLVSHRMQEIRRIATFATVIRDGRTVLDRAPLSAVSDEDLAEEMIGRRTERTLTSMRSAADSRRAEETLLSIDGTDGRNLIRVQAGTVVGITALAPADARRVVQYAWGAERGRAWRRTVYGQARKRWSPRRALRSNLAYVSGDRKEDALFGDLDLLDNVMTPTRVMQSRPWLRSEAGDAHAALEQLAVKAADVFVRPGALSGGNQQKMLFAAWLPLNPRLLLLDDPTRGVDVDAKGEIYTKVRELVLGGSGALWWSSDTDELAHIADEVVVVRGHCTVARLEGEEISETAIVTSMNEERPL